MKYLFVLCVLLLQIILLSVSMSVSGTPVPSLRSTLIANTIGPELNEIREHMKIIPEIRGHMNEIANVVQEIRLLIAKVTSLDKNSFFRFPAAKS